MSSHWCSLCALLRKGTPGFKIDLRATLCSSLSLVFAEICTASALISIGTVIGKTNPVQLILIAILEVSGFILNGWLLQTFFEVSLCLSVLISNRVPHVVNRKFYLPFSKGWTTDHHKCPDLTEYRLVFACSIHFVFARITCPPVLFSPLKHLVHNKTHLIYLVCASRVWQSVTVFPISRWSLCTVPCSFIPLGRSSGWCSPGSCVGKDQKRPLRKRKWTTKLDCSPCLVCIVKWISNKQIDT